MVRLDAGPTVVVHLHGDVAAVPARLRIGARLDKAGMAVLVGFRKRMCRTWPTTDSCAR
jgi:hypothetical protein